MAKHHKQRLADDDLVAIVEQARALRRDAEIADTKFLAFLVRVEVECGDRLTEWGCTDYAQFLRTHDLCEFARYERFKHGLLLLGSEERAQLLGEYATRRLSALSEDERARYLKAVEDWRTIHGTAPSDQAAARLANKVSDKREPRVHHQVNELNRLRSENQQLHADLRQARRRITELEAECARLRNGRKPKDGDRPTASP